MNRSLALLRLIRSFFHVNTDEGIAPDRNAHQKSSSVRFRIHTEDEYERALERIQELQRATADFREECELLDLLEAVELWQSRQDIEADWS